jgi:hypothetical protein
MQQSRAGAAKTLAKRVMFFYNRRHEIGLGEIPNPEFLGTAIVRLALVITILSR